MTPQSTPPAVKQVTAQELKAMLDRGEPLQLLDVRTEAERAIAKIEGARHLDQAAMADLQDLDRDTLLVFQCHHGMRSLAAAHQFLSLGFRNVANLVGGIEAWSLSVDPSMPRY
jgi:monothiol glutaredoxin